MQLLTLSDQVKVLTVTYIELIGVCYNVKM